jgi:hypothetical protein
MAECKQMLLTYYNTLGILTANRDPRSFAVGSWFWVLGCRTIAKRIPEGGFLFRGYDFSFHLKLTDIAKLLVTQFSTMLGTHLQQLLQVGNQSVFQRCRRFEGIGVSAARGFG